MLRSSGEKNTIFNKPKSSEAFFIGILSIAIPLVLFFLKWISIIWSIPAFSITVLIWASSSLNNIKSLSLLFLWDFVVPLIKAASNRFVFPCALFPYIILIPLLKLIFIFIYFLTKTLYYIFNKRRSGRDSCKHVGWRHQRIFLRLYASRRIGNGNIVGAVGLRRRLYGRPFDGTGQAAI